MSVEIKQMAESVELHEDEGIPYACACCNADRGYDFMDEMCADCYWDYDSLRKQPRRILARMLLPENEGKQEEMKGWLDDAKQRLADFEEKLAPGGGPKSLEDLAKEEMLEQLENLHLVRKQFRDRCLGREMTPDETAQYDALDHSAQALVDEYTKRNL